MQLSNSKACHTLVVIQSLLNQPYCIQCVTIPNSLISFCRMDKLEMYILAYPECLTKHLKLVIQVYIKKIVWPYTAWMDESPTKTTVFWHLTSPAFKTVSASNWRQVLFCHHFPPTPVTFSFEGCWAGGRWQGQSTKWNVLMVRFSTTIVKSQRSKPNHYNLI